jgi:hypothetical protein
MILIAWLLIGYFSGLFLLALYLYDTGNRAELGEVIIGCSFGALGGPVTLVFAVVIVLPQVIVRNWNRKL